ncbi:MAG: NACHT domain-containing protein [Elainella sp.]
MAKQTERTLFLTLEGRHKADDALRFVGSKRDLAAQLEMSPTTITNFFAGRKVDRQKFLKICQALKLKWQEVIEQSGAAPADQNAVAQLVQKLRQQIRPQLLEQCGTMHVLDMTQPIALTGEQGIYTNVNILEKLSGRQRIELSDLLKQCNTEEFERFGLSRMTEQRVPGLDAAQRYPKLMVLGKPGAGKTTFLKYLAMQCIEGNFLPGHLPVFVTLKAFAEEEARPDLLKYSGGETVTPILEAGRALILLDGLDEVREEDTKRVIHQIEQLSKEYPDNHFVITCRIAAKEYTFGQFTEVEVADFNNEQIDTFAQNWFRAKGDVQRADLFRTKLNENKPIKELASSPLLLTLLCLMFEDTTSFPANRSELYKEGLDVLLKKWDGKRKIERDAVYKNLSLKRKEDLLSQIALTTFERKEYFFKQRNLEDYTTDFIRNLPDAKTDPEALHLDSEAVLKSIEAHHGLLIERAKGIYSFSHLTFHEYFTAREIAASRDPEALKRFVKNVTDRRWREVFLLTAGMMRNADELMILMKQHIDQLLAENERLQEFLAWVQQKSASVDAFYELATVRAFYFALDLARDLALDRARDLALDLACDLALDLKLARALARARAHAYARVLDFDPVHASELEANLQQLREHLPDIPKESGSSIRMWWRENAEVWTEKLQASVIKHRSICNDWRFTKEQEQLLWQYYDANKLLVDCLNSDCYTSREVREEIDATLLLPVAAL